MRKKPAPVPPETRDTLRALKRAANSARKLAAATGTRVVVVRNGRIVKLDPPRKTRKSA